MSAAVGGAAFAPPLRRSSSSPNAIAASVLFNRQIAEVVSCHAWAPDGSFLAVCPNNEEIHMYERLEGDLAASHVLTGHTQRVTGLAWSCDGRLASVSEDRTAFVWEFDTRDSSKGQYWRPVNVELKAPRAALSVSWSPDGKRFAVGLASREVALCQYEPSVSCWVAARKVGKAKASVGAVAWHPSSQYLAVGTIDRRCCVYDVNEAREPPYGEAQVVENANTWVNAVAFSPSGAILAFAPQDSSVHFKDLRGGPESAVDVAQWRRLPFLRITFVADDRNLVACGFDYVPVLFRLQDDGRWGVLGSVDPGPAGQPKTPGGDTSKRDSFADARNHFKSLTAGSDYSRGAANATRVHTNTITACAAVGGARFSTSGTDGRVVVWEINA